jgi:hypothetical protein
MVPFSRSKRRFVLIQSLPAGSLNDSTVNAIIDFSKKGFGDTQMFGLLARRPGL